MVRAESRSAGFEAEQAKQPTVGAGDSGPPLSACGHRPAHSGQAGVARHCAAREPAHWCDRSIKSLAPGDVITFHDSLQVTSRADDQCGMDMVVAEEIPGLDSGVRYLRGWPVDEDEESGRAPDHVQELQACGGVGI